jgi:hypothetical protein
MESSDQNSLSRQLEVEGNVPEYLKTSLVSEIDLIKDSLQVVSLFGGVFFMSAVRAMASVSGSGAKDDLEI